MHACMHFPWIQRKKGSPSVAAAVWNSTDSPPKAQRKEAAASLAPVEPAAGVSPASPCVSSTQPVARLCMPAADNPQPDSSGSAAVHMADKMPVSRSRHRTTEKNRIKAETIRQDRPADKTDWVSREQNGSCSGNGRDGVAGGSCPGRSRKAVTRAERIWMQYSNTPSLTE